MKKYLIVGLLLLLGAYYYWRTPDLYASLPYAAHALLSEQRVQPLLRKAALDLHHQLSYDLPPSSRTFFERHRERLPRLRLPLAQHLDDWRVQLQNHFEVPDGQELLYFHKTERAAVAQLFKASDLQVLGNLMDDTRHAYQKWATDVQRDTNLAFPAEFFGDDWLALPASSMLYKNGSSVFRRAMLASFYAFLVQLENDLWATELQLLQTVWAHYQQPSYPPWKPVVLHTPVPTTVRVGERLEVSFGVQEVAVDHRFGVVVAGDTLYAKAGQVVVPVVATQLGEQELEVRFFWKNPLTGEQDHLRHSVPYTVRR